MTRTFPRVKTISLVSCILISLLLTLLSVWKQPLWLDEQYSLLFAKGFLPSQLLIHFTVDSNPGLYHLFLKSVLNISQNVFFLRVVTAVLPSYLGLMSLLWLGYTEKTKSFLLKVAPFLFLNPFLMSVTWQLRMYGLVIMCSCFFYVLLEKYLLTKKPVFLKIFIFLMFFSVLVHYAFFYLAVSAVLYLVFQTKSLSPLKSMLLIFFIFIELSISSGNSKEKLSHISWIPAPTIASVSSVYATMFGFSNDYFASNMTLHIKEVVFSIVLIFGALFFFRSNKSQFATLLVSKNRTLLLCILFGILPMFLILCMSFLFPVFSHLPFFYHYIPNVSFFIPRVQLSFFILLFLYLAELLQTKKLLAKHFYVVFLISLIWIINSYQFNVQHIWGSEDEITHMQTLIRTNPNARLFPSWEYISAIDTEHLDQVANIKQRMDESQFLDENLDNDVKVCQNLHDKTVLTKQFISPNLTTLTEKMSKQLSTCCVKTSEIYGYDQWKCF